MTCVRFFAAFAVAGSFYCAQAQLTQLSFRPIATLGSLVLDRIVMISGNPDLVHIYDPNSAGDVTVALPKPAFSLAVSPDGLHAAVGHDGLISWVDLRAGAILKTFAAKGQVNNLILGDQYVWYPAGTGGFDLNSGQPIGGGPFFLTSGVLDATQTAVYISNDSMTKVVISSGDSVGYSSWPYNGDYRNCGPYYLALDGSRIYTSCGTVVHSSSDKSLDMHYLRTLPVTSFPISGLTESARLKKLAVIGERYDPHFSRDPLTSTYVELFDTDYLTAAGKITLLPFTTPSGTFAARGQAVFFSKDEMRLFVVVRADLSSNLANGYGVEVIDMANPPPCGVQLGAASASVGSNGSLGTIAVTAAPACFYHAVANVDWIQIMSGGFGSGNGAVGWIARPNSSGAGRSGTITINGQDYTIQQDAAPAILPSPAVLSFNVVDAGYSRSLDRLVMVSAAPDELHIYDPVTQTERRVELVMPPLSVSVAPDGLRAAVGHDGWISYVDLQSASVLKLFPIVCDVQHVLLAANGYIYGFPANDVSDIYSLEIATGTVTATNAVYDGRIPALEPNGKYFYASGNQWFSKWDITNGVPVVIKDDPGSGAGFQLWLHEDGSEFIAASGEVYTSSDTPSQDVQYTGTYTDIFGITWAANSSALQTTALIPNVADFPLTVSTDTEVRFYGDAYLAPAGVAPLPQFPVGGKNYPGHGLYAFWNSAATSLYVIERADSTSGLISTDAIYTISPSSTGCTVGPQGTLSTIAPAGGFGGEPIVGDAGCPWAANSDSSWLAITSGAFGAAPSSIAWNAARNPDAAARTAHITINGRSYSLTQLGASTAALTLTPATLTFSALWGTTTALPAQTFTTNAGFGTLAITTTSGWISVTALSATSFSVSVNPSGLPAGNASGLVTVTNPDGQVQSVAVNLAITRNLTITPPSLTFQYNLGDKIPSATLSLTDGTSSQSSFSLMGNSYLNVSATSDMLPATVQVTPKVSVAGSYSTILTVYGNNKSVDVPVRITVTGAPISVAAVTSAGDFAVGPVAPGQIVVIWGSGLGPASLANYTANPNGSIPKFVSGTTIFFNGIAAPIIYTSSSAVCAIVPYGIAGQSTANVQVSYQGSTSNAFAQAIAPTAPHFFSQTYTPTGQLSALNEDYSPNSAMNPAAAGGIVILYATGEGVTSPPGVDGTLVGSPLPQPLAKTSVTIGGRPAEVLYAGGAPGLVEGLLQVDVRVPAGTPTGAALVTMQIGGATTPSGARVAVR